MSETLKAIMQLAHRGTGSLRHNGDDCVVLFDWPPSESGRQPIKVTADSWNDALVAVDRLVTTAEIMEEL